MANDSTRVPAINLDAPVTGEQFHAALQELWDYARTTLASTKSWCSDWTSYAGGVSSRLPADGDTVTVPALTDPEAVPASWLSETGAVEQAKVLGERYQAELQTIRGRLLYWVNNENLTLDEANEGLRRMGLPVYENPDQQLAHGYTVAVTFRFATANQIAQTSDVLGTPEDMQAKLQEIYGSDTIQIRPVSRGNTHRDYDYRATPVRKEDTEVPTYT